jgi:trimeric autotransporter adhesin
VIYSKYSGRAACLLFVLPLILSAQDNSVALKNWATPLYWRPNPAEKAAARNPAPQSLAADAVSPDALTFVAITPCRLVDTRGGVSFNGLITPFDGPSIQPGIPGITTFPVRSSVEAIANTLPAPCGFIPAIAEAYSLNMVVIPHGGQPAGFVTIWPSGAAQPVVATLNDYQGGIVGNAAIVGAGTPLGGLSVFSSGPAVIDLVIDMNGYFAAPTDLAGNTAIGAGTLAVNTGLNNTATGASAMTANTSGVDNTANGFQALASNVSGNDNTATGFVALASNTIGGANTANGFQALSQNVSGSGNAALGFQALGANTADGNTAVGYQALESNTVGTGNMASGYQALQLSVAGSDNTASGYGALQNSSASFDTASGYQALGSNTTGIQNTASGAFALSTNAVGQGNTATGMEALHLNVVGNFNTATGYSALANNIASANTATGTDALEANTSGIANVATGSGALIANTTGQHNTAVGAGAGGANVGGNNNTAVGFDAGSMSPITNNDSVYINSPGSIGDLSGTIQIGTQGGETGGTIQIGSTQAGGTFIAGIAGGTVSDVGVYVNTTTGRLGITASSERFKEQITDMGDSSSKLFELRPVNFFYKPEFDSGSHLLQYGLIAEDVAKVYPELVAYDKNGQILSIKYQLLAPMLLNELQKQAVENLQQAQDIRLLKDRLAAVEAGLPKGAPADR